jgi:hypothetical protein
MLRIARRLPVIVTAALALGAVAAGADTSEGVWVNGIVHDFSATGLTTDAAHAVPLYVIAPVDPAHPLHSRADAEAEGFGAHDHVINLSHPDRTFHGTCDLTLVVPGPKSTPTTVRARRTLTPAGTRPLLYAARVGGTVRPLTSAATIAAARRLGLAALVRVGRLLVCTVAPRA